MATVSQSVLLNRVLETMEDELAIPRKNARDFVNSLVAVVEESVEDGDKVSLFGIVTLTPVGVAAKPRRKGVDPRTGEERTLDAKPASLKVKATVGKKVKDALPATSTKVGKALVAEAKERSRKNAERAAQREAEAEKEAAKAARAAKRAAKAPAKKKSNKKKR